MAENPLASALDAYKAALEHFQTASPQKVSDILPLLQARDRVEAALIDAQHSASLEELQQLLELDQQVKEQAEKITRLVNLAEVRNSLSASTNRWWWHLETLAPPHPQDQRDWLWQVLSIGSWTATLAFLINIISRVFIPDPSLGGAAAIALPSILTLLQAKNDLTSAGAEGFKQFLQARGISKHHHEEAKLATHLALLGFLFTVWLLLPKLSEYYNSQGLQRYAEGKLITARQDYQRAISIYPDNQDAHYNLGNLYEELQEFDNARKEYLIAVQGQSPEAYNNLARLYIREQKYSQAAALLHKGWQLSKTSPPEVRYSLLKNLGWVRFEQKRDEEAQDALQEAIETANESEAQKYITAPASAHCLLAQVLERRNSPVTARAHWQKCMDLGLVENSDEDAWLHLAQQKLQTKPGKQSKKKP